MNPWIISDNHDPVFLGRPGGEDENIYDRQKWTAVPSNAVRFCRKEDAEAIIKLMNLGTSSAIKLNLK